MKTVISACKTGSAKRVTVVLPLFPYSRQPDAPYNKTGAPLSGPIATERPKEKYTFESVPATPGPGVPKSLGLFSGNNGNDLARMLSKSSLPNGMISPGIVTSGGVEGGYFGRGTAGRTHAGSVSSQAGSVASEKGGDLFANGGGSSVGGGFGTGSFQARRGYKQWVAQAGTLIADLLSCAGADQ